MESNNQNKFKRLSAIIEISAESVADYILPDYLGDIRRILFSECQAKPSGHFSDEAGDEFSGIAVYDVLYLDSENKPTRASFTSDFELRLKGEEGRADAICAPTVSGFYVRSTGPRRFSAGATVSAPARIIVEDEITVEGDGMDMGERTQSLDGTLKVRCAASSGKTEREFAERLERLDGAMADEVEIVYSGARANVNKATADGDRLKLEGELYLYALISNDTLPIYLAEKTVPFEEWVEIDGAQRMEFIPVADVVSVTSSVNPDEEGVDVVLSAIIELWGIGEFNEIRNVSLDSFVVGADVKNTYNDYRYTELYGVFTSVVSSAAELSSDKLCSEKIRDVPYLSGTFKGGVAFADGDAELCGEIRAVGVASVVDDNGGISYAGVKFSVPVKEKIKCENSGEASRIESEVSVCAISAAVDTESVIVNYKLVCHGACSGTVSKRLLASSVVEPDSSANEGKSITVYYPCEGDTLFEVAKKFRTPLSRIAAINELSAPSAADGADSLCGAERLLIY